MSSQTSLQKPLQPPRAGLLPSDWPVPPRFRERLGERAGRHRHKIEEGHLLLVLHEVPRPRQPEREPRFFWRTPAGEWHSTELGNGPRALSLHVSEFESAVDRLELKLHSADEAQELFDIIQEITPIHRTARNLHGTLQNAREAVQKDRDLLLARDRGGDLERACELVHAEARNRLELIIARKSEEHAEVSRRLAEQGHKLNMLIAVFLPITAVGSLFGLNLTSGLEQLARPWLFWGVALLAVVFGLWIRKALDVPALPARPPPAVPPEPR